MVQTTFVVECDGNRQEFDVEAEALEYYDGCKATFEMSLTLARTRSTTLERLTRGIVVEKKRRAPRKVKAKKAKK